MLDAGLLPRHTTLRTQLSPHPSTHHPCSGSIPVPCTLYHHPCSGSMRLTGGAFVGLLLTWVTVTGRGRIWVRVHAGVQVWARVRVYMGAVRVRVSASARCSPSQPAASIGCGGGVGRWPLLAAWPAAMALVLEGGRRSTDSARMLAAGWVRGGERGSVWRRMSCATPPSYASPPSEASLYPVPCTPSYASPPSAAPPPSAADGAGTDLASVELGRAACQIRSHLGSVRLPTEECTPRCSQWSRRSRPRTGTPRKEWSRWKAACSCTATVRASDEEMQIAPPGLQVGRRGGPVGGAACAV